jgi:hypothetical protein
MTHGVAAPWVVRQEFPILGWKGSRAGIVLVPVSSRHRYCERVIRIPDRVRLSRPGLSTLGYNRRTIAFLAVIPTDWTPAMKAAVTVIGWLAAATLGGWLVWWAVTLTDATPHAPATIALGSILVMAWVGGTVLVWQRSWFATLAFAIAAALPLTPEHALPASSLLVAVSAALAVWSWLAGMASWLRGISRTPGTVVARVTVDEQPFPPQRCVICQEPTHATICASCVEILGPLAESWQQGGRKRPSPTGR